jgi:hypothetical protein
MFRPGQGRSGGGRLGIHPAVLTDHGLGAAVRALADRCLLPVELRDGLSQRLDSAVEAALYYTVRKR